MVLSFTSRNRNAPNSTSKSSSGTLSDFVPSVDVGSASSAGRSVTGRSSLPKRERNSPGRNGVSTASPAGPGTVCALGGDFFGESACPVSAVSVSSGKSPAQKLGSAETLIASNTTDSVPTSPNMRNWSRLLKWGVGFCGDPNRMLFLGDNARGTSPAVRRQLCRRHCEKSSAQLYGSNERVSTGGDFRFPPIITRNRWLPFLSRRFKGSFS